MMSAPFVPSVLSALFVLLVFLAAASLTGALAVIIYRQNAVKALQGRPIPGLGRKLTGFYACLKAYTVKLNQNLVKNTRYENITGCLRKINQEDRISPEYFLFIEQTLVLAMFCLVLGATGDLIISVVLAVPAFFIPEIVLKSRVKARQSAILREMPDAFDIIGANIEGGLSINMAIARYSSRVKGFFAAELMTVIKKTQLGKSFGEAMRELDEKLTINDLTGFVNTFIQADKMGGNVKEIIRGQAEEIRQKRFQYLRKKAHEAPVKLLIPLLLFIFPVIFIVLFAPIVIKLMQG